MITDIKLSSYIERYGEKWADDLPDNCPPEDVCVCSGELFYRYTINRDYIVPEDWNNYLKLFPGKTFSDNQRIFAAGLSLLHDKETAVNKTKLPGVRNQFNGIAAIPLEPEDGVVLQSYKQHHYTWWRTIMCNLSKAQII